MAHTPGTTQVVRVESGVMEAVDNVMKLWREQGFNGPQANFANAARHLMSVGAEFERLRLEGISKPVDLMNALSSHRKEMRAPR